VKHRRRRSDKCVRRHDYLIARAEIERGQYCVYGRRPRARRHAVPDAVPRRERLLERRDRATGELRQPPRSQHVRHGDDVVLAQHRPRRERPLPHFRPAVYRQRLTDYH